VRMDFVKEDARVGLVGPADSMSHNLDCEL
jgi:hypothetical protein